ncbi:MAG: hypothetical protein COB35_08395 [Gammaproteobacteria bacterium]|nr:MAG: hypothetical protein COB35_08395 [Gammaproteobacteria bacterium]
MKNLNNVSVLFFVVSMNTFCLAHANNNDFSSTNTKILNTIQSTHIVRESESLFSIAKQYNISIDKLKAWNNIEDANVIEPGQKIALIEQRSSNIKLKNQAQIALTQKKYSLAIRLLTRLFKNGNKEQQQFALEFLGVAREKKGQKAFAKQAYQKFLKQYPQAKTAKRVKIRYDNLIGIETLTKNRQLKNTSGKNRRTQKSFTRGSLSSDYRKSVFVDNSGQSRNSLSLANIDLDARGSYQQENYNVGFRASVGHYQDFLPSGRNTSERIRYLSMFAKSKNNDYQVKLGRQRSRGKGIFGRFDGLVLSSKLYSDYKVNVVAGFPVNSSKVTSINTERQFYGLSVDVDKIWDSLDFSVFVFNQNIGNLTDRQAVGGQFNYYKNSISLFGLVDYDIFYKTLNAFLLSGSYATASSQRYSWSYNYRKSPYIGTRNALIGQTVDSLSELQNLFITDEEILDLAIDRTLTSKTASFQYYQPISDNYDMSTSFTWMNISGAPGSGGVPEISQSGSQYYGNINFSAKKIFSKKDTNRLGFRYSSLASSKVSSIYVSDQYRFSNGLSIVSKLRFDNRSNANGSSQRSISPTFRLQYQSKKHYLYTDLGAILYNSKSTLLPTQSTKIYYLYFGYRYYF